MTPVPVSDGGTAAAIVGPRSMLCKYFLQSFAAHQPREAQVPNYVLSLDTKKWEIKISDLKDPNWVRYFSNFRERPSDRGDPRPA